MPAAWAGELAVPSIADVRWRGSRGKTAGGRIELAGWDDQLADRRGRDGRYGSCSPTSASNTAASPPCRISARHSSPPAGRSTGCTAPARVPRSPTWPGRRRPTARDPCSSRATPPELAQVVNGTSPDGILDTCHAERHPAGARALHDAMAHPRSGAPTSAPRRCATPCPRTWFPPTARCRCPCCTKPGRCCSTRRARRPRHCGGRIASG
jgi:hypothetical protein